MDFPPLVSVVMPCYNAEQYIAQAISSVIAQTYTDWELIIVDDCSTDSTTAIVKTYCNITDKIHLFECNSNSGGPAKPRNMAIDRAKGVYIAFLDADDFWLNDKLAKQIEYIKKNNYNFISTDCNFLYQNEQGKYSKVISKTDGRFRKLLQRNRFEIHDVIVLSQIYNSTVIIQSETLKQFRFSEDKLLIEDLYLWLTLLNNIETRYGFLSEKLVNYRILPYSRSGREQNIRNRVAQIYTIARFILESKRFDLWKSLKWLFVLRIFKK